MIYIFASESALLRKTAAGSGTFGKMFPGLKRQGEKIDDSTIQSWLTSLGNALVDDLDTSGLPFPAGDHPALPAGYTYFGQFLDHDMTLDPTRLPTTLIDITSLRNFRSAALDLDSLLGFGPGVNPILYQARSAGVFAGQLRTASSLAGNPSIPANDLPRFSDATPIIGDFRNDENLVVAQLHTAFITFYNTVFQSLNSGTIQDLGPVDGSIAEKAARIVRWHYQWIVLHDFLPRILEKSILDYTIAYGPKYYSPDPLSPYMPVEFAGAAYRLGHTMVREAYHLNKNFQPARLSDLFAFTSTGGGAPVPSNWFINWNRFFEIDPSTAVNRARRLDPYLTPTLGSLPDVQPPNSLAVRNLLRGWAWGLPSGQDIAGAIGVQKLTADQILADIGGQSCKERSVVEPFNFHNDTPLWYYILKEAETFHRGELLGPVGSTLIAEVIVGLMRADAESFINASPGWTPSLPSQSPGHFTMADMFRFLPPEVLNPNGGDTGPIA